MSKKKAAIISILGYLVTMGMGTFIGNVVTTLLGSNVLGTMNMNQSNIIYKLIIQIPPTLFILYMIKKYYKWNEIGLSSSIEIKNLLWFLPYLIILVFMGSKFIEEFYKNISAYGIGTYILIIFIFVGTAMAGLSEEVIFRGIFLNSFKSEKSIIWPMLISSIGFSISHITTVVMGNSLLEALTTVFYSSLLGFAFVGLAIKMKNICLLIIFHILWNFILMASQTLNLQLSISVGICNILNIFMAIILWFIIIIKYKKCKKHGKRKVS